MSDQQIADILCVNRKTIQNFRSINSIETTVHNRIPLNHHYFSNINTEDRAYWLGFMYADGTAYDIKPEIKLSLSRVDRSSLESFKEDIGYKGEIRDYSGRTSFGPVETSSLCFSSRDMQQDLFRLGCVSSKTHILGPPPESEIPVELHRDFIRGYVDGDGYISSPTQWRTRSIEIVGTYSFLEWVSEVSPVQAHRIEPHKSIYRIRWSCSRADEIVSWLYGGSTRAMNRKKERATMFGVAS